MIYKYFYRLIPPMTVDFAKYGLDKINTKIASFVQNQPRNLKLNHEVLHTPILIFIHILNQFLYVPAQRIYFYRLISAKKVDFSVTGQYQCSNSTVCSNSIPKLVFHEFLHTPLKTNLESYSKTKSCMCP